MEPEIPEYKKFIRPVVAVVLVLVLAFFSYQFYLSLHFRVASTNPSTSNVSTIAPFLKINFNRKLSSKNLSVSSSYLVASSYKIEGETLVVNLKTPMTAGYEYYVKVNVISDTKDEQLRNKVFRFTPQKISAKNLPEDQRQALLKAQSQRPRSKNSIVFIGINTLVNTGVNSAQANTLEENFFSFAPQANTVSISNIAPVPHNPNSASTSDAINFSAKIDSTLYQASINYSALDDSIRLLLFNSQGSQVYDSWAVHGGKEGGID